MPVTWDFYVKRKRIQLPKWFVYHQIKDYDGFLKVLDVNDVIAPSEEEVKSYFITPVNKKTSVKKTLKKPNDLSVDEQGFLVAEQAKKPKKTPVRRKTRSTRSSKKATAKSK